MRHQVLARNGSAAFRLAKCINALGWYARAVGRNGHIGVIVHAPEGVLNRAIERTNFEMGRTEAA